jgi:hypothetical protein
MLKNTVIIVFMVLITASIFVGAVVSKANYYAFEKHLKDSTIVKPFNKKKNGN